MYGSLRANFYFFVNDLPSQRSSAMSSQAAIGCLAIVFVLQLQLFAFSTADHNGLPPLTNRPLEAFRIAREAYPFFTPVIANWRVLSATTSTLLTPNPVEFDTFRHGDDVRAPNDNVIYSLAWLDVRQEARVVTVPQIRNRYYSLQIIDGYTHNIGIVSDRTVSIPVEGGRFIVAGPEHCSPPDACICSQNIDGLFRSEGIFALLLIRIQVFNESDITTNIVPIQQQFGIQRLSEFCDTVGPIPLPIPDIFPIPLNASITEDYFHFANRIMGLSLTIHPTEVELFKRFARIGVIPGKPFPPTEGMSLRVLRAIRLGILAGLDDVNKEIDNPGTADERLGWQLVIDPPQFGTREVMQGRYLTRAAAARAGIYGLDPEEAFYPSTSETALGFELNGGQDRSYYIYFRPLTLPPVFGLDPPENMDAESRTGFWSISMYRRGGIGLTFVPNPIDRFSIGSRELSTFCRYNNESFVIIMQAEEPQEEGFRRNWLPAPDDEFFLIARLYSPRPIAVSQPYLPPPVQLGLPSEVPTNCPPLS